MHRRVKPDGVFEPVPGLYSQVVAHQRGPTFEIAGTLAYRPDGSLPESLADQSREVMANIGRSLAAVGLDRTHVVRINVFTTDIARFLKEALDIVFGYFGDARPASTLVEVSRLSNPAMMVEIEAVAVGHGHTD